MTSRTFRTFLAAPLFVFMGALQAWDSHVLDAPAQLVVLTAIAIAVPAAAFLLTDRPGLHAAALGAAAALLVLVRIASPVRHNELLLVATMGFLFVFCSQKLREREGLDGAP